MTLLHTLEKDDIRLHRKLEGARVRIVFPIPVDVTMTPEQRATVRLRQEIGETVNTPWKVVKGWKISSLTYSDLGPVWKDNREWTFDQPQPKAP